MTAGGIDQPDERRQNLSAAARRELLAELGNALGGAAAIEGDRLILEAGEGVAIHGRVEPDGTIGLIWWLTDAAPSGHPRWREVAAALTGPGEAIYTSALGGGYVVEVEQRAASVAEAARLTKGTRPVERVRALATSFVDAVAALPPEPVPDYLLPEKALAP